MTLEEFFIELESLPKDKWKIKPFNIPGFTLIRHNDLCPLEAVMFKKTGVKVETEDAHFVLQLSPEDITQILVAADASLHYTTYFFDKEKEARRRACRQRLLDIANLSEG